MTDIKDYPPIMTTTEMAEFLRKHEVTLYNTYPRFVNLGIAYKDGRRIKWWRDKMVKHLERQGL